jgi:RimJ/RimL family protein N-acetyltransferase
MSGQEGVVVELTPEEFHAAARRALARIGLTYAQLADQAARRRFDNAQVAMVWTCIGDSLPDDFT